jgi:hypothetical protein
MHTYNIHFPCNSGNVLRYKASISILIIHKKRVPPKGLVLEAPSFKLESRPVDII